MSIFDNPWSGKGLAVIYVSDVDELKVKIQKVFTV